MRYGQAGSLYQLRLEPGEEVVATVTEFVRARRVGSGTITGLGAADRVELGWFDRRKQEYVRRLFPAECEIASLTGNIAWHGDEPVCHLHAVVAAQGLAARAGHLFRARVTVTCEVGIVAGAGRLERSGDPATGLKLLDLPEAGPGERSEE